MKIVILDGYTENPGDLSWKGIEAFGELQVYDRSTEGEEQVIERSKDADILVTNKTPITRAVIDACPNLKLITVLATGYNVVDYVYAKEKGIPVCNVPGYGTMAVSQFAIALLLEICHHIAFHDMHVKSGRWSASKDFCFWDYPLIELDGKTAGIIGFGRIGQATARIAAAMGMKVIAYDSHQTEAGAALAEYVGLDELLARADVIFLHCPLFPETEGLINKDTIAKMKNGVILINNSRGPLVVEDDLCDALDSGKVYAAGLDVTTQEPLPLTSRLLRTANVFVTPHISWATKEARQRIMDATEENIRAVLAGSPVNVVNGTLI
ncbi:MAG: D-2-hydroxyacid dehydrogenase [Lachnospiraceae bacterium]|nr:D-2-hydroxyacid dehydrogenase [Lachnospiraceae bacterium]